MDIVDREKYPNYLSFGFGTYIIRSGIKPGASFFGYFIVLGVPALFIKYAGMHPVGNIIMAGGIISFILFLLICPVLLYKQTMLIKNGEVIIKIGDNIIRQFRLSDIDYLKKGKRFNGAIELHYRSTKMMFLFSDTLPDELKKFLISD